MQLGGIESRVWEIEEVLPGRRSASRRPEMEGGGQEIPPPLRLYSWLLLRITDMLEESPYDSRTAENRSQPLYGPTGDLRSTPATCMMIGDVLIWRVDSKICHVSRNYHSFSDAMARRKAGASWVEAEPLSLPQCIVEHDDIDEKMWARRLCSQNPKDLATRCLRRAMEEPRAESKRGTQITISEYSFAYGLSTVRQLHRTDIEHAAVAQGAVSICKRSLPSRAAHVKWPARFFDLV